MSSSPELKTASIHEVVAKWGRKISPVFSPDWRGLCDRFMAREVERRILDGVIYEPRIFSGVPILAMHRPIALRYLTEVDFSSGDVRSVMQDDEAEKRFARSTVVAFFGDHLTYGMCKADNSSPSTQAVDRFLTETLDLEGAKPRSRPAVDPAKTELFKKQNRASRYSTSFVSQRALLKGEKDLMADWAEDLAEYLGEDIRVKVDISFTTRNPAMKATQRFHKVVRDTLGRTSGLSSNAEVETIMNDGSREVLNLVEKSLRLQIELPESRTERESFDDLVDGMIESLPRMRSMVSDIG